VFTPVSPERPVQVPFAVLFGVLVAAVDGYLAWLLSFGWYLVVPVLLALAALAGAALVWFGRRGAWVLLAVAAVLPLLGLLALAALFGILGGGSALWSAVLLLVAPLGCLALVLQRPVRQWCGAGAPTRSRGGRRGRWSSR
jgi:hypothetical protein